ncbi:single-strand DNA-binding protein [Williamsoniiplasma luminosum]|uniref:Single-strand DNA-binding protein n=1 Tax=Williamsoniiplasma luminosum TaxID=214888 RepID=A0A2K8NXF0_9MOLU|nr:single-stranded DNA-binding protein [Williamsoniiplasma luminosum]ATZ17421.1 single-strand DNA-binding protein [Williamsoniiplasma luminosum]AVP49232.1 MAG: single-stranded DNA-binding protein [Williamsoniiplasma luminosum]
MNNVNIIGQIEGDAQIAYTSQDGARKLYKFVLRVPRPFKKNDEVIDDLINVKCWSTKIEDEDNLHDQAYVGIEGRIQSFGNEEFKTPVNEVIAFKILYLE